MNHFTLIVHSLNLLFFSSQADIQLQNFQPHVVGGSRIFFSTNVYWDALFLFFSAELTKGSDGKPDTQTVWNMEREEEEEKRPSGDRDNVPKPNNNLGELLVLVL